jgi:hypothetical protein
MDPDTLHMLDTPGRATLYPGPAFIEKQAGPKRDRADREHPAPARDNRTRDSALDALEHVNMPVLGTSRRELVVNSAGEGNQVLPDPSPICLLREGYARLNEIFRSADIPALGERIRSIPEGELPM